MRKCRAFFELLNLIAIRHSLRCSMCSHAPIGNPFCTGRVVQNRRSLNQHIPQLIHISHKVCVLASISHVGKVMAAASCKQPSTAMGLLKAALEKMTGLRLTSASTPTCPHIARACATQWIPLAMARSTRTPRSEYGRISRRASKGRILTGTALGPTRQVNQVAIRTSTLVNLEIPFRTHSSTPVLALVRAFPGVWTTHGTTRTRIPIRRQVGQGGAPRTSLREWAALQHVTPFQTCRTHRLRRHRCHPHAAALPAQRLRRTPFAPLRTAASLPNASQFSA